MFQNFQFLRNYFLKHSSLSSAFNVSTREVKAGGSLRARAPGQPGLQNETLSQDGKRKERKSRYFLRTLRKESRGKEEKASRHMKTSQQDCLHD